MEFSIFHKVTKKTIVTVDVKDGENKWLAAINAAMKMKINLRWADFQGADFQGANLRWANFQEANFRKADLQGANFQGANFQGADLRWANFQGANFQGADLRKADLRGANFQGADLRKADLRGANLDFSSGISFQCKSFNFKADLRLAAQIAYHFCRIDFGDCEEAEIAQMAIKSLANKFHRVDECGKIK